MDDIEANKAVVRRHLEEAVTLGRYELWEQLMAEDFFMHHAPLPPGRAGYQQAVAVLRAGFSDLRIEVLDLVAEGDRVVARYMERGTHDGDFLGRSPSGRSYEKHGFALYRLADGQLAECWIQEDDLGHQSQLFG